METSVSALKMIFRVSVSGWCSVIPNCFHWAAEYSRFALLYFFRMTWLLKDVAQTIIPIAKVVWRDTLTSLAR